MTSVRHRFPVIALLTLLAGCTGSAAVQATDPTSGDTDTDTGTDSEQGPFQEETATLHPQIGAMFIVRWTQVGETDSTWVEYSFDADEWWTTPPRAGSLGAHEQLVIGAPYEHEVTWRVVGAVGDDVVATTGHAIETDDLPAEVAEVTVDEGDPTLWDPDARFLLTSVSDINAWSSSVNFWISVLDRKGRYVWLYEAPAGVWTLFPKPARDGAAILWDEPYYWTWANEEDGQVHRMRLDGTVEHTWSTPWLHHSFDDLSPDTIVWHGVSRPTDVVYSSTGDEAPVALWDCWEWMQDNGLTTGEWGEYCANNALAWDEITDTILLSEFAHEMLVALDPTTGAVRWYADPSRKVGLSSSDEWFHQHDAHFIGGDRVLLFTAEQTGAGVTIGSGAYEFAVDTEAGTLDLVWSAISDDWLSAWKGGATRMPSGNTLVYYGDFGGAREFTPDGEVVWEVNFDTSPSSYDRPHWVGRSTFLDDLYAFVE